MGLNSAGGDLTKASFATTVPLLNDHAEDRNNSTEYTSNNNSGMATMNPSGGNSAGTWNAYLHYFAGSPKNSAGA